MCGVTLTVRPGGRARATSLVSRAASGIGMGLTGYVSGAQSHTTINCVAPLDGSGAGSLRERLGLYIFKMSSRMSSYHTAHTSVLERVGPSRRPALSYYRPRLTCVYHVCDSLINSLSGRPKSKFELATTSATSFLPRDRVNFARLVPTHADHQLGLLGTL